MHIKRILSNRPLRYLYATVRLTVSDLYEYPLKRRVARHNVEAVR